MTTHLAQLETRESLRLRSWSLRLLLIVVTIFAATQQSASAASDNRFWTLTPYRVRVLVAVESRMLPSKDFAERIATHLDERSDASIGAIWKLTVEPLAGTDRLKALEGFDDEQLLEMASGQDPKLDKLIVLTIRETPLGFTLSGVECDTLLQRIGSKLQTPNRPLHATPEAAFALLCDVFSPLALFEVDRSTGVDATLTFRGSKLPAKAGAASWGRPGDIFLPMLRRTDREGEVVEEGIQAVPWTFLLMSEPATTEANGENSPDESTIDRESLSEDRELPAKIYSHTNRAFGVRRRGRVEQYAILLRQDNTPSFLRLHVREKPDQPLPGYQAYSQDGEDGERVLIGISDADGRIEVPAGTEPIQIVYIKSGSQVVAKAPVPVGTISQIEIPLLDERVRLEAEAKISLLREELIDLIARRSILAARIRNEIKSGNRDQAQKLLEKLDGMPGRALFSQKLNRVQQQAKSDDPQVQQRIDRLFSDTAAVLGAFLGTGEVDRLRRELAGS